MYSTHHKNVKSEHTPLQPAATQSGGGAMQLQDNRPGAVVQRKLIIESSSASPFTVLKYPMFQSLRKRMDLPVEAWGILKQMAVTNYNFKYSDWQTAIKTAHKVSEFGHPEALAKWTHYIQTAKDRKTIRQPGYATGDQFGIAAALILNPMLDVVISAGPTSGKNHDHTDKAAAIRDFYLESGIEPWRITLAHTTDVREKGAEAMLSQIKKTYMDDFGIKLKSNMDARRKSEDVSWGTTYIAENWSAEGQKKLRSAWGLNRNYDKQIAAWLQSKGVPVAGRNVAILWSRFSGKKGDIHLEHDTSYAGMRQLVMEAARHYTAVIIAGDPSATPKHADKYTSIAKTFGLNVFNLTGFWNDKTKLLYAWGGNTRTGQFRLYDYLNRKFQTLKHLGSRSGNLEAMAMLGHTVRYMEEPASIGGDRMAKWHAVPRTNRTASGGLATGYERLMLEAPVTRSGKYLKEDIDKHGKRPIWAPLVRPTPLLKPPEINSGKYQKGFSETDMEKIRNYLELPSKEKIAILAGYHTLHELDLSTADVSEDSLKTLREGLLMKGWMPNLHKLVLNKNLKPMMEHYTVLLNTRRVQVIFK